MLVAYIIIYYGTITAPRYMYVRSAVRRRHKSSAQLTSGRNYGEWPCRKHPAAVAKALCSLH